MDARAGDRLVIRSNHTDRPVRDGEILEVHGAKGSPPYLVLWSDTGRTSLMFPGQDAFVEPHAHEVDPAGQTAGLQAG